MSPYRLDLGQGQLVRSFRVIVILILPSCCHPTKSLSPQEPLVQPCTSAKSVWVEMGAGSAFLWQSLCWGS